MSYADLAAGGFISRTEFAQRLNLSLSAVERLIREDRIISMRFGRRRLIPAAEIARFGATLPGRRQAAKQANPTAGA